MRGGHVQQLETTRLFGEIFFFQKGGACLREEKMGYNLVEPLRFF